MYPAWEEENEDDETAMEQRWIGAERKAEAVCKGAREAREKVTAGKSMSMSSVMMDVGLGHGHGICFCFVVTPLRSGVDTWCCHSYTSNLMCYIFNNTLNFFSPPSNFGDSFSTRDQNR